MSTWIATAAILGVAIVPFSLGLERAPWTGSSGTTRAAPGPSGGSAGVTPLIAGRAGDGNGSPLEITAFAANPTVITRGNTSVLSVSVSGGSGPLTFAYDGLPVGCVSLNGSTLSCFPSQTGTFRVTVQVTDVVGDAADAGTNLTVNSGHGAPPRVTLFAASPAQVEVRRPTFIVVAAVSESSTASAFLSYAYFDLPPGCASFNQTNLTCLPTQPGTYHPEVQVTDGFGSYTFASTNLTVLSGPSGGSASGGIPSWVYGAAALGVVAIALIAAAVWLRRR